MGMGDEILAAGQAQRHYELTGERSYIVDQRDRPRWSPIWDGNPILVHPDRRVDSREPIHRIVNAPGARPYIVYPFTEQTGWTFNRAFRARDHLARIYLTRDELRLGADVRRRFGPYVLIEPWSKHENLRWPLDHWEDLIRQRADLTFVQHIHADSPLLTGPNVHHVQTTFRQACGLVVSAQVYLRGESGMLHAAAALGARSIALWGGCMDWEVLGGYPGQYALGIQTPYCGRWLPCTHCSAAMRAITVTEVCRALDKIGVE
jgi:hypothetical protein